MNHTTLVRMYTSNYRYSGPDRVDVTVKGQDPNWKEFAPTWDMVMGIKNGTMSEKEYVKMYLVILNNIPPHVWDKLLHMKEVTLVCFCPEKNFCHRNIIINYIFQRFKGCITYGGFRHS